MEAKFLSSVLSGVSFVCALCAYKELLLVRWHEGWETAYTIDFDVYAVLFLAFGFFKNQIFGVCVCVGGWDGGWTSSSYLSLQGAYYFLGCRAFAVLGRPSQHHYHAVFGNCIRSTLHICCCHYRTSSASQAQRTICTPQQPWALLSGYAWIATSIAWFHWWSYSAFWGVCTAGEENSRDNELEKTDFRDLQAWEHFPSTADPSWALKAVCKAQWEGKTFWREKQNHRGGSFWDGESRLRPGGSARKSQHENRSQHISKYDPSRCRKIRIPRSFQVRKLKNSQHRIAICSATLQNAHQSRDCRAWEMWDMETEGPYVALKSHHGTYISFPDLCTVALSKSKGETEKFQMLECHGKVAFRARNGNYLSAAPNHLKQVVVPAYTQKGNSLQLLCVVELCNCFPCSRKPQYIVWVVFPCVVSPHLSTHVHTCMCMHVCIGAYIHDCIHVYMYLYV